MSGEDQPTTVLVALRVDAANRHAELAELAAATGCELAYLQVGEPSLHAVLDRLADAGATHVRLARVPGDHGKPGRSWLRRVAGDWVRAHPSVTVTVSGSTVTGDEAPLRSDAWEQLPPFRHHVLVCRGPRCTARGAEAVAEALAQRLRARDADDDHAMVTQAGCLYPCNHAPVVAVHPDDVWYGQVDGDAARAIVDDHLLGAGPPASVHRVARHQTG